MYAFFRRLVCGFAGIFLAAALPLSAQDITLRSADGTVEVSGTLLDYDGEFFRIDTRFGEMTLNALGLSCIGLACPDPGQFAADITLSGNDTAISGLLPGLIEAFGFSRGMTTLRQDHGRAGWTYFISDAARVPLARLQASAAVSGRAIGDIIADRADIAITTRLPAEPELELARTASAGDLASPYRRQVLAIDALVFIVSPLNPVRALSLEDIAAIYSGRISNWADLGGIDAPIALYRRQAGSELAGAFAAAVFPDGPPAPMPGRAFRNDRDLSDTLARDPFGLGYTGFAGVRNARALALRGACGIRMPVTMFNLQAGDYPLTRYYYVLRPARRLPVFARSFLTWLDSDAAQLAIADLGFVGQDLHRLTLADQPERIANAIRNAGEDVELPALQGLVTTLGAAERLSATLRFDDNSTNMDARSERNIRLLADMLELGEFDGREIIIAGFSDGEGSATGNRRISRARAEQVQAALSAAASRADLSKIRFRTIGLGEVSPLACDDTPEGRRINRRVEIWLR
ncbi:MAG: substrate-binding domain-containing protein [Rhodobacteraceae bacterium]|nr:substrate-binding domain-containing protein [Paracoccaceae bacterium]